MLRLSEDRSFGSAGKRLLQLFKGIGIQRTAGMIASVLDDQYLKLLDRKYQIKTSGYVYLKSTSFDPARLRDATSYAPVNGWAFRKLLNKINLPHTARFVDLGCGLGRASILAAEYGFSQVTGVELAAEFCAAARRNVRHCRLSPEKRASISIQQMDALDFCRDALDDIFFMYRPFSAEFLIKIMSLLADRAEHERKPLTIIYSERMLHGNSHLTLFSENKALRKISDYGSFGQAFYVYQFVNPTAEPTKRAGLAATQIKS